MSHEAGDSDTGIEIESISDLSYLSRRGLLRTGATALPFFLAGCGGADSDDGGDGGDGDVDVGPDEDGDGGDGGGGGDGGDGGDGGYAPVEERIDTRFVTEMKDGMPPIPNANFNVYNPTNYLTCCEAPGAHYFAQFQLYYDYAEEEHLVLGDSWEMVDETTVRQTLRDDITWWDGTPVTTKDIEVLERMDDAIWAIQNPDTDQPYVADWEIVDEQSWDLNLRESYSERFVKYALLQGRINVKADVYEPHVTEIEDLLEDNDMDGAEESLVEFLEMRFGWDEQYGNGPYKYKNHDDTRWILEVNEEWPYADTLRFTEYMWQEFETPEEAFINLNTSAIHAWQPSEDQRSRARSKMERLVPARQDNALSMGYHINLGIYDLPEVTAAEGIYDPVTGEPEGWLIRKGLMYAMDNEQNIRALPGKTEVVESPIAGIPYTQMEPPEETDDELAQWVWDTLENYAPHQPEKAREMFETAGWTYDEGEDTWYDWNDEEVEITMRDGSDPSNTLVMEQNLTDLGLNVNLVTSENFGSERHQGEFELIPDNGSGTSATSIFGTFPISDWYAMKYNGPSGSRAGREWQVPTPVGNTDVTDPAERESWEMLSRWEEFLISGDEQLIKELMWMRNQYLTTADYGIQVQEGHFNGEWWYVEGPRGLRQAYQPFADLLQAEEGLIAPRKDADVHPGHFQ